MRTLIVAIALFVVTNTASAQILQTRIVDQATGAGISDATVSVRTINPGYARPSFNGPYYYPCQQGHVTDCIRANGTISIASLPYGRHTLQFWAPGHLFKYVTVDIGPSDYIIPSVPLAPLSFDIFVEVPDGTAGSTVAINARVVPRGSIPALDVVAIIELQAEGPYGWFTTQLDKKEKSLPAGLNGGEVPLGTMKYLPGSPLGGEYTINVKFHVKDHPEMPLGAGSQVGYVR